jgi:hypothetical protein
MAVSLNFGDVSPFNDRNTIVGVVPVRVSAGCSYTIGMKRSGSHTFGGLRPSDIGFGVRNIRAEIAGSGKLQAGALGVSILGQFADDPRNVKVIEGLPRYSATLEHISEGVDSAILQGPATAADSDVGSDGGSILADLIFVIVPQYFDPSEGTNMTLELTINPT